MVCPPPGCLLCSIRLFDSCCFQYILFLQLGSRLLEYGEGVGAEAELELCQGESWSWSTCLHTCALHCNGIGRHNGNQWHDKTFLTGLILLGAKEAKREGDRKQKGNKGREMENPVYMDNFYKTLYPFFFFLLCV